MIGPVEKEVVGWQDASRREMNQAIVLDAAGATDADVEWAVDAVDSQSYVRRPTAYFFAVVHERIAMRIIAERERS